MYCYVVICTDMFCWVKIDWDQIGTITFNNVVAEVLLDASGSEKICGPTVRPVRGACEERLERVSMVKMAGILFY